MNLIERYLHEVRRYLPAKNREDILAEIRSHLTDTLEERVKGEPGEEDMASLLKEMGSPRKLAASYPGGDPLAPDGHTGRAGKGRTRRRGYGITPQRDGVTA